MSHNGYNQFDCFRENIERRVEDEMKCNMPFLAYNQMNETQTMCKDLEDFESKCKLCTKVIILLT